MPFIASPGVAQIVLAGQYGSSEQIVSVLHVQRKNDAAFSPWSQPELRAAASRMSVAWQRFTPFISSQVAYNEIRSRDMGSETGAVDLLGTALNGGTNQEPCSPNVTYLIQWRTGTAGRGANGRTYLPGANEPQVDNMGRIVVDFRNAMTGLAQSVLADLGAPASDVLPGVPLDLVIVHKAKGVPLSRSATKVVTGRMSNLVATQRRRLPKRA